MDFLKYIKKIRHKILINLYCFKKIQKNKIIFWSDSFKSYGCNPKYLCEYLLSNYKDVYDIVWVFDATLPMPNNLPQGIRIVKYFSLEYLKELHTAKYVVCNARTGKGHMWHKRKGQIYIQTWHSSLRLKTIEKDAINSLPEGYIKNAIADSSRIDYIISGCEFSSNIFKNSFWYDGKILECGTPRIDYLMKFKEREEVLQKIGLDNNYKYILYSPTFRDNENFNYNLDFKSIIKCCEKKFGGKWKVLYRLHPNLIFKITEYDLSEECINVCSYPDMQELVAVADLMITDYSSCMFDFMYIKKPCILYMPDFDDYVKSERKLYFDIKSLPFIRAFNENEIVNEIENYSRDVYENSINSFMEKIGSFEKGNSCEQIAKEIFLGK